MSVNNRDLPTLVMSWKIHEQQSRPKICIINIRDYNYLFRTWGDKSPRISKKKRIEVEGLRTREQILSLRWPPRRESDKSTEIREFLDWVHSCENTKVASWGFFTYTIRSVYVCENLRWHHYILQVIASQNRYRPNLYNIWYMIYNANTLYVII